MSYDAQAAAGVPHAQITSSASAAARTFHQFDPADHDDDDTPGGRKKGSKRRKVNHACVFCRRSHMTCDEGRPCQRCIKRDIGNLCHDEQKGSGSNAKTVEKAFETSTIPVTSSLNGSQSGSQPFGIGNASQGAWSTNSLGLQPGAVTNEFSFLTEFLENLDDSSFFNGPQAPLDSVTQMIPLPHLPNGQQHQQQPLPAPEQSSAGGPPIESQTDEQGAGDKAQSHVDKPKEPSVPSILPSASKKEKFLLMAADQETGSRDERLNRVIQAKYEAGLLKPYDYVKGYARLSRWMDRNVSQDSKQQILQPLSQLRPKFRSIASSLRDMDLVFIEEAFERLLLDYDRVFSAMGIPACLWRRTGEIYKGNREFAELVGVNEYMLRDGRLCIYEVMSEESAVNFWEKYGQVAFDSAQKAVLTSCMLKYKPNINYPTSGHGTPVSHRSAATKAVTGTSHAPGEEGFVNCCFSFTIRRDFAGIPIMIVGNFIKC